MAFTWRLAGWFFPRWTVGLDVKSVLLPTDILDLMAEAQTVTGTLCVHN